MTLNMTCKRWTDHTNWQSLTEVNTVWVEGKDAASNKVPDLLSLILVY
jgi:hypothetical protein